MLSWRRVWGRHGGGKGVVGAGGCTVRVLVGNVVRGGGRMYGRLIGIFPWIADVVGGEFDGAFVDGGEELLGEGDFGHDGFAVGGVERFWSVGVSHGGWLVGGGGGDDGGEVVTSSNCGLA